MIHQPAPIVNRRRVRLVDDDIQKTLLVALVLMETIGVAIAIWMLYRALGEIVDENTYRIHFAEGASILSKLSREGLRVFGVMLAVNVVALIIADRIWAFHVKRIVRNLDHLMDASRQLDFTGQEALGPCPKCGKKQAPRKKCHQCGALLRPSTLVPHPV